MKILVEGAKMFKKITFLSTILVLCLYTSAVCSSQIRILNIEPFINSPTDKGIFLELNSDVNETELRKALRFTPSTGYFTLHRIYRRNKNMFRITGNFVTDTRYKLSLIEGPIEGTYKSFATTEKYFTAIGPDPEITFAADRSVLELYSRQMVPLRFANTNDFRCRLVRIPHFFAPHFDSLAVFAESDERKKVSSSDLRPDKQQQKMLDEGESIFDELLITSNVRYLNLLKDSGDNKELKRFLGPGFSSDTRSFLGSDDDREHIFSLPLDFRPEPEKGGALIVKTDEIDNDKAKTATKLFQITDLSITTKNSQKQLLIWITSMETGSPVPDASIMITDNHHNHFFPGRTDKDGILIIETGHEAPSVSFAKNLPQYGKAQVKLNDISVVSVATENDSSFKRIGTSRLFPSNVVQTTSSAQTEHMIRGHVFTERGVYRPGEKVYWKTTVRQFVENSITAAKDAIIKIEITSPRFQTLFSKKYHLNDFGTAHGVFELKDYFLLGRYNLRVYLQTDKEASDEGQSNTDNSSKKKFIEIASTGFQVQHFQPPRHFVNITTHTENRTDRSIIGRARERKWLVAEISSEYYAGGPLRHAKVQWTAHLTSNRTSNTDFPFHTFGSNDSLRDLIETGTSILSEDGKLKVAFPLSQEILSGLHSIEISATVLDVDSKAATGIETFSYSPKLKVGISQLPSNINIGTEFPIEVIVVDEQSNKVSDGKITLEIMQQRWFYTQKRSTDGAIFYRWTSAWSRASSNTQPIINNKADFDLIFADGGEYMLRATYKKDDKTFTTARKFGVSHYYNTFEDYSSERRTRSKNEISLISNKNVVQPGQKATIRWSLPAVADFALLTTELACGKIDATVIKDFHSTNEIKKEFDQKHIPNAHIGIIIPSVRTTMPDYISHTDTGYPRAWFGYTNIRVQNEDTHLDLEIEPDKPQELIAQPGEKVTIKFKVSDKQGNPAIAELAICVVDEAILALTGYQTPLLQSLVNFSLPLTVFTADLRASLLTQELFQLLSTRELTGGGHGTGDIIADLQMREDFRPVAYWNPTLLTDKDGYAEVEFVLPDSMTSYRVYAVAINKQASFASEDRQLRVSKDFYIEPGLPPFLTAGDKARVPVLVNNRTDHAGKASIRLTAASNICASIENQEIEVLPNTTSRAILSLEASSKDAKIELVGNFMDKHDSISRELAVNTDLTIIRRHQTGHFRKNAQIKPELPEYLDDISPEVLAKNVNGLLRVSPSPISRLEPALNFLTSPSHDYLERLASRLAGLSAVRSMVKKGYFPDFDVETIDQIAIESMNKLLGHQRASGGFSWWSSGRSSSWWGTQYALLALTLAQRNGYDVPEIALSNAINYVRRNIFLQQNRRFYSEGIMALSIVNLALNDKLSASELQTASKLFKRHKDEADSLILWAETLLDIDNNVVNRAKHLKRAPVSVTRGWRYSPNRQNAFSLLAILNVAPNSKEADNFAGALIESVGSSRGPDTAIAIYALAKYFELQELKDVPSNLEFELETKNSKKVLNTKEHGITIQLSPEEIMNESGITLKFDNDAMINWSLEYVYPDIPDRKKSVDQGFAVNKRIDNLNGNDEYRVGDIVKITLEFQDRQSKYGEWSTFHYLTIDDPVPAGFTILNTQLKNEIPEITSENEEVFATWRNNAYVFYPDHYQTEHDRMLAFKDRFWSGRFRLTYYARVSTEGTFLMKPTVVSMLYDPDIMGMTKPQTIKILPAQSN